MRRKLCRAWTADDIDQLRKLAAARWSAARIGARLRRSPRVVKIRALLNGIQLGSEQVEVPGSLLAVRNPEGNGYQMREQTQDQPGYPTESLGSPSPLNRT
jgi:hypothetical protein